MQRDQRHRRYLWITSTTKTGIDEKRSNAQHHAHYGDNRRDFAFALPRRSFRFRRRLNGTRRSIELCFVNNDERRLVEVATRVGVRIDEEALGATFHRSSVSCRSKLERLLQYATGLFED